MGNLQFRLLGMPVVVEPWFWLAGLLLGINLPPPSLLIWMAAVFLGIMVHELGHALIGRAYGLTPSIRLWAFGGLTYLDGGRRRQGTWQSIAISFAGPGAGFLLALVVWLLYQTPLKFQFVIGEFLYRSIFVNFWWGLVNLLPVLPLDGGNIMRELVRRYVLRPALELPLQISMTTAGLAALVALVRYESVYVAAMMGILGFMNYQELQRTWRPRRY